METITRSAMANDLSELDTKIRLTEALNENKMLKAKVNASVIQDNKAQAEINRLRSRHGEPLDVVGNAVKKAIQDVEKKLERSRNAKYFQIAKYDFLIERILQKYKQAGLTELLSHHDNPDPVNAKLERGQR